MFLIKGSKEIKPYLKYKCVDREYVACVYVCVLYFNMGEVTLHLHVDGKNPEEREIFLEERIAGVMYQYFSR